MLGFFIGLFLYWYYFYNIENNTFLKNVSIFAVENFVVSTLNQLMSGETVEIIYSLIASIIVALISVKIMEFTKQTTNSLGWFIIINEILLILVGFAISYVIAYITFKIF